MSEPIRYIKQVKVSQEHLDQLNHVNNIVYLQWVQEISEEHWRDRTTNEIREKVIWMVLDHHIMYKKQALLGDELRIVTFVKGMTGVRSIRHVEVWRGDELLVETHSQWCMLDIDTLRPKRVPEEIIELF
ncbi:MAG: thioesterase family protein [Marinoscillum sp.]